MSRDGRDSACDTSDLRAIVLTALRVEFKAVVRHLSEIGEVTHKGSVYEIGRFSANGAGWEVLVVEIGPGNAAAAFEAERAISFFSPAVALFIGVAGGVKDVQVGDVVAATRIYGYESGKATKSFLARPDVAECSYPLIQRARAVARRGEWLKRTGSVGSTPQPEVYIGPVAAGEKVVTSARSEVCRFIKNNYNDTLGVEMEGRGFLSAAHANQALMSLVIRGISDLLDNKGDPSDHNRQARASCHASAFGFEVLANLQS